MRLALIVYVSAFIVLAAGCEPVSTVPPCYPVTGQVLQSNKPVAEAIITFHPLTMNSEHPQKPIAYTDAEGRFSVSTFGSSDGAPAGEYAVTVELRAPRTVGEEVVRDGRNLLPVRYSKPETSKLSAVVAEGENAIPLIDLQAR